MVFPTIPTIANGRVLTANQANTTSPRTFPNLSSLTKNSGDLLIAIVLSANSAASGEQFSNWGAGFTEVYDSGGTGVPVVAIAYKWSTGSETGTFTVTQAVSGSYHATMFLLSISGAHDTTPPAVSIHQTGLSAAANPVALNPANWDVEDTLWIAVGGCYETATTGSFTGITASNPTNYTNNVTTAITADVVGGINGSVAFRQLATDYEDPPAFTTDTSNTRSIGITIAVRPAAPPLPVAFSGWGIPI